MDNHVPATQADLEPIRAALLHLSQTVPVLNRMVLNSSTQVAKEFHTIRMEVMKQSTITDQHHRAYLTMNNKMVDNMAELQDRIMDSAHRHPLEMLQGDVTVLREQIDELRKQVPAISRAEDGLRQFREVVQEIANGFTGIEQLVGNLETRVANYEGQIDELTHVRGLQRNEISQLTITLATLEAHLINSGLIKTNIHADIRKWIDKFVEPQACQGGQAAQASIKLIEGSPQPVFSRVGTPLGRTRISEAEAPALGSPPRRAIINNPAVVANAHNKNHEHSSALPPQPSTTTPSFPAGLNPEAPSFNSTSSLVLNLPGEDSTAGVMSNPAEAAKGGPDKPIKKETQGLEHSTWAFDSGTARPARQQEPRELTTSRAISVSHILSLRGGDSTVSDKTQQTQGLEDSIWASDNATDPRSRQQKALQPIPSSASSVSHVLNVRGGESAAKNMTQQTQVSDSSIRAPGNATAHQARKQEARQPISSASSESHGNVAVDKDWSAGLRQSMWAPRADEANRHEAYQPKMSRAVAILDTDGKPVSATVLPGRQGIAIAGSTGDAPILPASSSFAGRSSTSQKSGLRADQATIDGADTTTSTATAQSSIIAPRKSSNPMIIDNTAQFIANFHRLIQKHNFTITQAAAIIYREAYGAVDRLDKAGAHGPSTTDDSQLASKFARLVLQDDNAHAKHVQAPIVPIGVKKDPKPLSLKTELNGALRFNEQLNKNSSTNAGQEVGDKEGPREVKRRKTGGSTASRVADATTDASRTDKADTKTTVPTIVVSTACESVKVDGKASITFYNVKYKVKASGSYGNKPTLMVGHLHKAAYDQISINLTFTVARGNPPKIAITAATANGPITITFILPVCVQSLGFIKRIANDPTVFPKGSEPMNELSALRNRETGVIPGHLRKITFTYNTCNLESALAIQKRESELRAMDPSEANVHRFFAAITDWQGGVIEALFTDEENDAKVVDKVLGVFEALYATYIEMKQIGIESS